MEKAGALEPAPRGPAAGAASEAAAQHSCTEEAGVPAAAVGSQRRGCEFTGGLIPPVYREELCHVLKLAGPMLVSRILDFLLPFVITIFCGHIGNSELAGYALASAIINVTTLATGYGLSLACDTLISQTYGAQNLHGVGVILQRSIFILLLFCLPCWAVLINTHGLLLLMGLEEHLARIAQLYAVAFLPAVPAMFLHQLQVSYLQNQEIILPQMYVAAAANVVNLGVNYVLIHRLEMGVIGSAIAKSLSQITICLMLFGYIRWRRLHKNTWGGWSPESLQYWGSYMRLAIPSCLMVCFEWWIWDIGGFLAGILGNEDLAAHHVLIEIGAFTYMFPLGINAAACVRVGNALGAGETRQALVVCKVTLMLSGVIAVFQGVGIAASKSVLGYIFTSDETIVRIISNTLTLYTFIQFFDTLVCVSSGILVGAGRQKIAALTNGVTSYGVGLPVGIALMFATELRLLGLWLGLLTIGLLQTGIYIIIILKLDWQKATQEAQVRAGKNCSVTSQTQLMSIKPEPPRTEEGAGLRAESYRPVSTTEEQPQQEGCPAEENDRNTETEVEAGPGRLSAAQLALRRGLTLLAALAVLALGITVHLVCPLPESAAQSARNLTAGNLTAGNLTWADSLTTLPTAATETNPF